MSEFIRANVTRAGVANPVASNITVQMDKLEAAEAATYAGSDPHFTYRAFTFLLPMGNPQLILFRDYVVDQVTNDAVTGTLRKYLIVSDPEPNPLTGSWNWICVRQRGT